MDSTSLTKPVDLQGLSLALAKTKADYEAKIDKVAVQPDWNINEGESGSILHRPIWLDLYDNNILDSDEPVSFNLAAGEAEITPLRNYFYKNIYGIDKMLGTVSDARVSAIINGETFTGNLKRPLGVSAGYCYSSLDGSDYKLQFYEDKVLICKKKLSTSQDTTVSVSEIRIPYSRPRYFYPYLKLFQSDWENDYDDEPGYIANKPAIRAGEGEGSIVEGINELPNDATIYTIYVSKEYGKNDTFTYTTEDTLPTANNLKNYGIWYDSTQTQGYLSILNIDTTNQTITVSSTYALAAVSNREIKIYYKYSFAKGKNSHIEGSNTIAIGANSHAEGSGCQAIYGHAEGGNTKSLNSYCHAEGFRTIANGIYGHAEGQSTQVNGLASHAEGRNTIANGHVQHVQGKYNIEDAGGNEGVYAHIVGNGTAENARSNAHTLDWSGNAWYAGKVSAGTVENPANPTADNDLATKAYVDANAGVTTLSALTDTTISSASNGQILTYNGTNSKWENTNLPSDVFVITVTSTTENDVTTYSADKTFAEITAAHTAGKGCIVVNSNAVYTLMYISSSLCRFVSTNYIGVKRLSYKTITINSDDTVETTDSPFFSYEGSNNAYSLKTLIAQVNGKANTTSITGSLDYSSTAYRAYNTGDLFWLSNTVLAKATTSIASGATLTLNTNYVKTTIEDELKARANTSDVLTKTNTTSYTPTSNYHPATKKYVDDTVGAVNVGVTGVKGDSESTYRTGQVNITAANIGALTAESILDATKLNGTIPTACLPSYVDDVLEYSSQSSFPATGESGKIYVDTTTNLTYRWSGSAYVEISPSLALGTTSSTAFRGDYGNSAYTHAVTNKGSAFTSGLYKITTNSEGHVTGAIAVQKSDITGLGIPAQDTTYTFDGTYNASTNKAATVSTVTNAVSSKANTSDVLTKTNTTSYTPTANYHPATKKYVDDNISRSRALIVNITDGETEGTWVADKTFADIFDAYTEGTMVFATYNDTIYQLVSCNYDDTYHNGTCSFNVSFIGSNNGKVSVDGQNVVIYKNEDSSETVVISEYGSCIVTSYLSDLIDTNVSSPTDGQLLKYNATSGTWENVTLSLAINNGVIQLKEGNTVISSVTLPVYNGGVSS